MEQEEVPFSVVEDQFGIYFPTGDQNLMGGDSGASL